MKWKPAPTQILIALNAMLLFFVLLGDHLFVPRWLHVAGRLHPAILHFPIVLIIAYTLCLWLGAGPRPIIPALDRLAPFTTQILLWSAFAAAITALAGVFLSKEGAYEGSAMQWHKWLGTLTSVSLLSLYLFRQSKKWLSLFPLATVILAGHFGGNLTHGEGYVLAPLRSAKTSPPLEEARVYDDLVLPVLDSRCMQCHNAAASKGGLNMEDPSQFENGGRNGRPWDTTAEGLGILLERIHLPADDHRHMPPADKVQLTEKEEAILYAWIRDGAPFNKKVTDLAPTDTLRMIAARQFRSQHIEHFDFPAANDLTIAALNTNYRTVTPLAKNSPALAVDFYGAAFFRAKQLQELLPVKDQVVSLNLDKMPVTDNDLSAIAAFINLRRLNLDFTRITGAGLATLARLPHLESLSLSGTGIKGNDLGRLAAITSLRKIYLWKTGIASGTITDLHNRRKDMELITGVDGDTVREKLNAPRLETEARIIRDSGITIRMRHFVPGAAIRYTLDGSDPDTGGKPYTTPFLVKDRGQFIAKAYKPGWLPSDPATATFYTQKYPPDSIRLLLPIDSNYMKISPKILIDADKGGQDFGSGKWLGFHKNALSAILLYRKPVWIKDLTFSGLVDIGAYIFPPDTLEVWGGADERHLKRLAVLIPSQPGKSVPPYLTGYRIDFPPQKIRCLHVIADPVRKLPDWHPGKGQPAWIFFDELLVN